MRQAIASALRLLVESASLTEGIMGARGPGWSVRSWLDASAHSRRHCWMVGWLFLGVSCGGQSTNPDGAISPDGSSLESGIKPDQVVSPDAAWRLSFSSCTLLTKPSQLPFGSGYEGIASAMAECATTKAPAVWNHPNGDSIDLFVKRYPAAKQPAKGQLWLLTGGPGGAGTDLEPLAYRIAKSIPALDIYLPDHRGTGRSSPASCGDITPATAMACANKFPHLDGLTATDAAKDLAGLIDATRTSSQQAFVLGISYGTYWAQRHLQVRPYQPTAVILDSTLPAVGMVWTDFDKHKDNTAHAVLALCQSDATCSAKLGPDPHAKAEQALAAFDAGKCVVGSYDWTRIRFIFGVMYLGWGGYYERLLLPASIYRVLRCNAADRTWLSKVFAYQPTYGYWGAGYSDVVYWNIARSEFWPPNGPTPADLVAQQKTMLAIDDGLPEVAAIAPLWPAYPHDAYYGSWPSSPAPILVLQGGLDPATPYAALVKPHYSRPGQHFVELPKANHGVVWNEKSPMVDPAAYGCGWQVAQSFLADPAKAPDTSCIKGMAPLDFGNPPAWWLARVGIQDLWENP